VQPTAKVENIFVGGSLEQGDIMPIKLGRSVTRIDRVTKKATVEHDYMHTHSTKDLIEKYNNDMTRKKDKRKIKIELVKRGGVSFG